MIEVKVLLQRLWKLNIKWDDLVPSEVQSEWEDGIETFLPTEVEALKSKLTQLTETVSQLQGGLQLQKDSNSPTVEAADRNSATNVVCCHQA